MSTSTTAPAWTRSAQRLDRPAIDVWWKPELHGPIDGILIWQGDAPDRRTGEPYHLFAIREHASAAVYAVTERAALRSLRQVGVGARVYFAPAGVRELDGGKRMMEFEVYAQEAQEEGAAAGGNGAGGTAEQGDGRDVPF
jgi:hypothetical protein